MTHVRHRPLEDLTPGLNRIRQSPLDGGTLEAIVIRPAENERISLPACDLSLEGGVHGDSWANGCWLSTEDGRPDPDVQITLINTRLLDLLADDRSGWHLAGDQLCVDLNLGPENLPVGQLLQIGSAVLQITHHPHTGCAKFAARYGTASMKFVNSPEGTALRLRGVYARVVQDGRVTVGDAVTKLPTEA